MNVIISELFGKKNTPRKHYEESSTINVSVFFLYHSFAVADKPHMYQLLDYKLACYLPFLQNMRPGVFHASSDTIEVFDLGMTACSLDINAPRGVKHFCLPVHTDRNPGRKVKVIICIHQADHSFLYTPTETPVGRLKWPSVITRLTTHCV